MQPRLGAGSRRVVDVWAGIPLEKTAEDSKPMIVGLARITFRLQGNQSLKEKRRVVKSLIEKSRHRFQVSVAEVADQDVHQRVTIGVSVVGSDGRVLNSLLDRIVAYMESMGLAELVEHELELISLGD